MSKVLKNDSGSSVVISDTGITILDSTQYTIPPQDYSLWAASSEVVTEIGAGTLVVNDGSFDLGISDGVDLIKGIFQKSRLIGNTDSTLIGNVGDRLKVVAKMTTDLDSHLSFGNVTSSSVNTQAVRKTEYIEPTSGAQRSISSSSFSDSFPDAVTVNTLITKHDLTIIYPELRTMATTDTHAATFGNGETLLPNIYFIGTAGSINGILTLDGNGDSDAVFVFNFQGALTVAASSSVVLTGGVQAQNVFFTSSAAISIGATSTLTGIYISEVGAVTLGANSSVGGKMAAMDGSIVTNQNNITNPTDASQINLRSFETFSLFTSAGNLNNTLGPASSTITGDIGTNSGTVAGYNTGNQTVTGGVFIDNSSETPGTGAITVNICYFTSEGAGPYEDVIVLSGTTPVNSFATDICFIEHMTISTAGATGTNTGTITLFSDIDGDGTIIGSIAPDDNRTQWCHHYVPEGSKCQITSISGAKYLANGTPVTSFIRAKSIGVVNATEMQVTENFKLIGTTAHSTRGYHSRITVEGPARLVAYIKPSTTASQNISVAFDFIESIIEL
jgi:hypothetical protein